MNYITDFNKLLKQLIILAIIATAVGLFFPLTSNTFGPYYGTIAKNIVISGNWADLVLTNKDWLDKPHFPFWITAASFKIFGINSFAYMLPGFIFHLIGALYTYKLSNRLYHNETISLLATLIYFTVLHTMLSAVDVRAEAYLLGQIMPAVYYWLDYDEKFSWKSLFIGAFFTGLALMTKGVFVVITIVSGVFSLWVYEKRLKNIISPKWWIALALSFIVAIPEIFALYLQFDLHPEKLVFDHTHVSGIRWFFIDSQFGRFFGTGYIHSNNRPFLYQLYFVHTFLWAFLPWTFVYPTAVYYFVRNFKTQLAERKRAIVFLLGNFWISFLMFSVTSFQVDHYTNIIFPFAAILCASFMVNFANINHKIFAIQQWLAIAIIALVGVIIALVFSAMPLFILAIIEIIAVFWLVKMWGQIPFIKAIILPVIAICLVHVTFMTLNGLLYHQYDVGYLATEITNDSPATPVVDYKLDSRALEFYTNGKYYLSYDLTKVNESNFFVVTNNNNMNEVLGLYPNAQLVGQVHGNTPQEVIPNLINHTKLLSKLESYDVILVKR